MKLNILAVITLLGCTAAAVVIADRQETSGKDDASVMLRGCKERFIDCQDCYDRYWACQQDSIPSSINWYGPGVLLQALHKCTNKGIALLSAMDAVAVKVTFTSHLLP